MPFVIVVVRTRHRTRRIQLNTQPGTIADGHHTVVRIPVNTNTEILCQYFQETDEDHTVRCFSARVHSLVDPIWYVGVAEAHPDLEDVEERIIDIIVQEGTYKSHWLKLYRAIREFGRERLAWVK